MEYTAAYEPYRGDRLDAVGAGAPAQPPVTH